MSKSSHHLPVDWSESIKAMEVELVVKDREETERDKGGEENDGRKFTLEEEKIELTHRMIEDIIGPDSFSQCGFGCWRSSWMQKLASPVFYLAVFGLAGVVLGMLHAYNTGTITTIERRFGLSSKMTGFITTGNDVMLVVFSLHLSQVAGRGHRPRWMAAGFFCAMLGCLLIVIPHILFGAGEYNTLTFFSHTTQYSDFEGCRPFVNRSSNGSQECAKKQQVFGTEQYVVIVILFFGQAMTGLARLLYFTIGYSYLDEAVSKEKIPLYFAISGCLRIFGPVAGSGLASWTLRIWVDPSIQPRITPEHPQWVGAWWIGYVIISVSLLLSSVFLLFLPRMLPSSRKREITKLKAAAERSKEIFLRYRDTLRPLDKSGLKDLVPGLKRILRRRIFLIATLHQMLFWVAVLGYRMFSSKYMEHQFKMSAADSNKYVALAGMVSSLCGWVIAGAILTFLKPSTKVVLIMLIGFSSSILLVYAGEMFITCESDTVYGMENALATANEGSPSKQGSNLDLLDTCIASCSCGRDFSPVCARLSPEVTVKPIDDLAREGYVFFSACHAGCDSSSPSTNRSEVMYHNCSCLHYINEENSKTAFAVSDGYCSRGCSTFPIYLSLRSLNLMLISATRLIFNIIFFRSVDERDKDLALGVLNVILSFSLIVCLIFIGMAVDYSCQLWASVCGQRGYCAIYDVDSFRLTLHLISLLTMGVSLATMLLLYKWRNDIDFFGTKEKQNLGVFEFLQKNKSKPLADSGRTSEC